jgi:phage terminase small subunit
MGEIERENIVPGQSVLPGMAEEMGYETIVLKPIVERFCWEYVLRGDNQFRAYKTVKPDVKDSTARVEASKLLTNPDVRARIGQIREELKRRYKVTAEDVLQYHGRVLKTDRTQYLDERTGKPRNIDDIDPEALSILEFDCQKDKDGDVVVLFRVPKRHDSAVEIARIMGMHKDKTEITGAGGGPIVTEKVVQIYIPDNGRD